MFDVARPGNRRVTTGQGIPDRGTTGEVFGTFLKLGLTSFGGPIAHIGYFRDTLVTRRHWVSEAAYAELVALCQLLPGPTSSQVGIALGLARAGPFGALAAWTGFTLPSATLMLALALAATSLDGPMAEVVFHGLKLVAVVIVAQAVWGMARTLTPDASRKAIAVVAAVTVLFAGSAFGQAGAIILGAIAGLVFCRPAALPTAGSLALPISRRAGAFCLGAYGILLIGLPIVDAVTGSTPFEVFGIFYRAGALVFGGGHVVLPLLRVGLVPGLISNGHFLAGYGAAQALPGPLFAIAAYLGAVAGHSVAGAGIALAGIFLPGMLVLGGVVPFWAAFRHNARVRAAIAGVNAAVVGILALALYDPLWTSAVGTWRDAALIAIALFALLRWKPPPLVIVVALVAATIVSSMF